MAQIKNIFPALPPAQAKILKDNSANFKTKFSEYDFKLNPKYSDLDFGFLKKHQEV